MSARGGAEMTRLTQAMNDDYKQKFKAAGVTFVEDVDREAFRQATLPVYKAFPKRTPNLHETVTGILK